MHEPMVWATHERCWMVDAELSADRWGNEGLHVLVTPALACLFENACTGRHTRVLSRDCFDAAVREESQKGA